MGKIAIDLDDETIAKARGVASSRNTTLDEMVQEFVRSLAQQTEPDRTKAAQLLRESFKRLGRKMGPRTWTRDDLYERYLSDGQQYGSVVVENPFQAPKAQ